MYFLRLARLKPAAAEIAMVAWDGYNVRLAFARQRFRVQLLVSEAMRDASIACGYTAANEVE